MKKKQLLVIAITAVLVIVLAYLFMPSRKKSAVFDGRVTLGINDKNPYGCYATYQLLSQMYPRIPVTSNRKAPAEWEKISLDSTRQLVLIVAKYFNPTEDELHYLSVLAAQGNYIVISALEMNYDARKFFRLQQMYLDAQKGDVVLEGQPMIRVSHKFGVRVSNSTQSSAATFDYPGVDYSNIFTLIDTAYLQPLGYNGRSELNLAGVISGNGAILLHTAPVTFTNFFALYHNNYRYLQQMLALMPGHPSRIIWDEYFLRGKVAVEKGMLTAVLQHHNFRWAFWLVLVVTVLFLITGVKRRQRLIPWHPKPVNDSLEFISVIGKLYYEKGDHTNMAQKMTQFFLEQVRQKYQLDTQDIQPAFAQQLAAKAGITPQHAQDITDYILKTKAGKIDATELAAFYGLLHDYYKTT